MLFPVDPEKRLHAFLSYLGHCVVSTTFAEVKDKRGDEESAING